MKQNTQLTNQLEEIGLSKPEARTYLALHKLQEAQTGELAKIAKVHSSKIYEVLEKLIEKGLVSYRLQNNIKMFQAAPPEALINIIEKQENELKERKTQLLKNVSEIQKIKPIDPPQSRYKYYEGTNGITSLWREVAQEMQQNELLIYASKHESKHKLNALYEEFHKERVKKKIPLKIIHPIQEKENLPQRRKLALTKIKFDQQETSTEISIIKDKIIIQHLGEKPHGFLIYDELFAETFKEIFNKLWAQAKKE